MCKQLGSGWDAKWLGVSPRSKLFDTRTTLSQTLSHIEAIWKSKQTRNLADDNLFGGLRVNSLHAQYVFFIQNFIQTKMFPFKPKCLHPNFCSYIYFECQTIWISDEAPNFVTKIVCKCLQRSFQFAAQAKS